MKKLVEKLLIIGAVFLTIFAFSQCKKDENSMIQYWFDNIGSRTDLAFLPDSAANYFTYSFTRKKGDPAIIKLKGEFPYARYFSYNIYDTEERTSLGSLVDTKIEPITGHFNPFRTFSQNTSRTYEIIIAPNNLNLESYNNVLSYDDAIENITIMIRVYMPEEDVYGKVGYPAIEAFDGNTEVSMPVPSPLELDFNTFNGVINRIAGFLPITQLLKNPDSTFFFKFSGAGLFQNFDNTYLFTPIELVQNRVLLFRFIPPTFVSNLSEIPDADVRFYSFGLGDYKTYNYKTMIDEQFKISDDGYVYVVIARPDIEVMEKAKNINFMPWPEQLKKEGILIYRNLLVNEFYPYKHALVPDILENIDKVFQTELLHGHTYLGDRAPRGKVLSRQKFLETSFSWE
jgi:hypothetical protein